MVFKINPSIKLFLSAVVLLSFLQWPKEEMSSICSKFGLFAFYFPQQVWHRKTLILIKTVENAHSGFVVLDQFGEELVCQFLPSLLPLSLHLSPTLSPKFVSTFSLKCHLLLVYFYVAMNQKIRDLFKTFQLQI